MSKAEEIMRMRASNEKKLELMLAHSEKICKWVDKNEHTQTTYSQDELAELLKETFDFTIELQGRVANGE